MADKKVIILGAGGHAKVVLEGIDIVQYKVEGFLDKDSSRKGEHISGFPVLGDDSDPGKWFSMGITCCIVGIGHVGHAELRNRLFLMYAAAGFEMINAVHPTAYISPGARMGSGTVIMPGAIVNSGAVIGDNCIINTAAVIEHDVKISNGVHIAPGCVIAGTSCIGDNTFIGAGTTVINGICIGCNSIVGAGSVVVSNLPENSLSLGIPARVRKEI
ncbi:MAG: acetyltransferase [Lachnospiraceae bacterium]|nr:acetyltransferase [Lachnospiraceae bacterium]